MTYTCPDCGKQYPLPPKWCGCIPYPMHEDTLFWKISGEYTDVEITEAEFSEFKEYGTEEDTDYRLSRILFDAGTPETAAEETEEETVFISKEDFSRIMRILEDRGAVKRFDIADRIVYKRTDSLKEPD